MPAVTFTLGAETFTFDRTPERHQRQRGILQPSLLSTGAERIGADYYVKDDLIDLSCPSMPTANLAELNSFWLYEARGMAKSFVYSDVNGITATVRFSKPTLPDATEKAFDSYQVKLQLRVV